MNPAAPRPPESESLGRYEVLEEIGRGAMGVVLLAHDPALGRNVAIKHLRPDLKLSQADHDLFMRRMRHEAQAIARVNHSGIVALHDIGHDAKRGTFLVFERAEGPTLEAVLERGRLTNEGTARLAREMGDALAAAHRADIVHRDIKPGNIILTEEGSKIADFGVARLPDSTLTKAGARIGTPAYSAPESISDGQHSPRSDQFSMAACLYEGLSGRRAYPGKDAVEVALAIDRGPPEPISTSLGLPAALDDIFIRAMSKRPSDRFENCQELGRAVSEVLVGRGQHVPSHPDERLLRLADERNRSRALGSALLWLLLGAILSVLAFRFLQAESPPMPSEPERPGLQERDAYFSPVPSAEK